MLADSDDFIHKRCICLTQKPIHIKPVAPLQSIITSSPMELVAIDFLHLAKSSGGHEYLLIIVDHFTCYAQCYTSRNNEAVTAVKHSFGAFVLKFGLSSRILHGQGKEFENKLFAELHQFTGIAKSRPTLYHPECNGAVERMNSTLLSMLRTLPESQKKRWHEGLSKLMFAYNATRHNSTGFSPHYLLLGCEPVLPLDLILGLDSQAPATHSKYVKWRRHIELPKKNL